MAGGRSIAAAAGRTGAGQPAPVRDGFVRVFHWSLAALFLANATVVEAESRLHEAVGYAILGLVALRILRGFAGPRAARFSDFPPSLGLAFAHLGELARGIHRRHHGHNPLGALMVCNLLATMLGLCVSGILIGGPGGPEVWEEVHEALFGWAVVSVALHVAGVAVESRLSHVNLIRAMVTGRKDTGADRD